MNQDFTLDDFWTHLQNIQKQGREDMLGRMPGTAGMVPDGVDPDAALRRVKGMIEAMTPEERADPARIDAVGRGRIAAGAGVQPEDVGRFLEQFDMMRALMRDMMSMSLWQRVKMVLGFRPFRPPPPPG